ncbi:MAG: enoyl-CoA hydratase/isomerase family protein [Pseudorhodoplanes sp.]
MIEMTEREGMAVATMRHGKANALDIEFCTALTQGMAKLAEAPARAIVLTGQGGIFSAGVDLRRVLAEGPDYLRRFLPALHALYETLFFLPKPVVAAINGHAIAGGCVLACCADRRVMVREKARIGVPELLVGVPFPHLAFEIMRFVVASHRFEEVMLGSATYLPEEGHVCGLADILEAPEKVLERALAEAGKLAALPPQAFAMTKRQSRRPVAESWARVGRGFEDAVTEIWTQPDALQRIRAYVERTLDRR